MLNWTCSQGRAGHDEERVHIVQFPPVTMTVTSHLCTAPRCSWGCRALFDPNLDATNIGGTCYRLQLEESVIQTLRNCTVAEPKPAGNSWHDYPLPAMTCGAQKIEFSLQLEGSREHKAGELSSCVHCS